MRRKLKPYWQVRGGGSIRALAGKVGVGVAVAGCMGGEWQ